VGDAKVLVARKAIKIATAPLISRESIIQRIHAVVQGEERDLFKFNAGESPAPGSTTATLEVNDRVSREGRGQRPRRSRPMSESSEVKLREETFTTGISKLTINDSELL